MPRIRTIKPEFWGDEKLAPMSPIDRLVFLGLLSFADDAGRLLDNVKAVDGFVFPHSDDTSRDSLARLAASGRIVRYESDSGQALIQIANWKKHQKIDHPAKYVLPAPTRIRPAAPSRDPREDVAKSSRSDLGPTTSTSTKEQRTTTPPPPRAHENASQPAEPEKPASDPQTSRLLERLVSDDDRAAVMRILASCAHPPTFVAELHASLDGMSGHVSLTPLQAGQAIRDFVGNGRLSGPEPPSLRSFRRYLELAATEAPIVGRPAAAGFSGRPDDWGRDLEAAVAAENAKDAAEAAQRRAAHG